jgi:flavin reductase (DIM6/NTAB) family NADH-FMN oxidoreductase RutF
MRMAPDPRKFRDTLGLFATGVSVVACEVGEEVHAMTANAVSALSLEPMAVLFCPSKHSRMFQKPEAVQRFTLNILRDDQQALSSYFARGWKEAAPPPYRFVPSAGGPRLEGCLASIACATQRLVDGGDHWIVIGEVLELHQGIEPRRPLVFFNGKYRAIDFTEGKPAPDLTNVEDEPPYIFYDH